MKVQANRQNIFTIFKTFRLMLIKKIILPLKKYVFNEKYKTLILVIVLGLLVYDIFLSPNSSDIKFYGITILFFITALFYRLKSSVTFIICLVLLMLMYINFVLSSPLGPSKETEKIAVWLFLFMVVGIIQQWKE